MIEMPLPGATIVVRQGTRLVHASSTDADGKYILRFTPGQTFHVSAEMMAFTSQDKDLALTAAPCDATLDFELKLLPRTVPLPAPAQAAPADQPAAAGQPPAGQAGTTPPVAGQAGSVSAPATSTAAAKPGAPPPGRGFTQLGVNADATGTAAIDAAPPSDMTAELSKLLPPGFSLAGANAEAVSVSGGGDAMSVDRSMLNDRMGAIGRGEFDPATGQFSAGQGPGGAGGAGGDNPFGQGGGQGGRGGEGGGGRGGGGGFAIGGRGGRGQSPYQGTVNYTFGGSALDAASLQPHNGEIQSSTPLPFARNNFGATIGGPLVIPGLYKDTNRRTNFQVNYTGGHNTSYQDQSLSVPTDAMRNGDFSGSTIQLINPRTGLPFENNQIPKDQMDSSALALLNVIPVANQPGFVDNFRTTATTLTTSNAVSFNLTQNLTPNLPQRGRGGAGGGGGRGGGGGGGGRGGPGGRGGRGLTMNLNVQLQYRESQGEQFNVVPALSGTTKNTSFTLPVRFTVAKGRTNNTFTVNVAHTNNTSSNQFSNVTNVGGLAGISYPTPQDPLNWGVPNLTFSNFNIRQGAANERLDTRITTSYVLSKPIKKHQLRFGADFRHDASSALTNANARGAYTFTGLYSSNGAQISRTTGADFADFLLGMPQQATLQVGGLTELREKSFDVYLEDNWQKSSHTTFNLGIRWEVTMPYSEADGKMANLDVTPDFTAASVVLPGQTGAQSGIVFPNALVNTQWRNIGPRVGMAHRLAKGTVLNTSYSITYNTTSYASIAQKLVAQPPFAETGTNTGTLETPLSIATGLLGGSSAITNNFGVDPNYGLGMIQTWNATVSKVFWKTWTAVAGYTGTKGTSLDLLRAPNRNPDGSLRIDDVQAFNWESSGGHSILSLGNFSIQRGLAHGLRFGVNYTLAKSMDNASSLGSGGAVVAQNDHDLEAEWAASNFDRRHLVAGNLTYELPFGKGRKWLSNGGTLSAILGEWTMNLNMTVQSGTPFTPRVVGATSSVANGTSGSLRANYSGDPIALSDPNLLTFFNTGVFSVPAVNTYGTSPRNIIIGPGGHVVNASFSRDMRIGGNKAVSLVVNANNLFNTIQWTSIDTNINSNTFGQVTRFGSMRTITINMRFRF
jgi:hypothetical protein